MHQIKRITYRFLILFAMMLMTPLIANAQTVGGLERTADQKLSTFLTMKVTNKTNGSTDSGRKSGRAWYCFYEDKKGGNGKNMKTSVTDIGTPNVDSVVNQYASKTLSTTNSTAAEKAMRVAYFATKSYMKKEPWGATQKSPYRLAMQYFAGYDANAMKKAGLFNSQLNQHKYSVNEKFEKGDTTKKAMVAEAQKYIDATKNLKFSNQSKSGVQKIVKSGNYTFVGPYKIQKTGGNAGGLSSTITSVVATDKNGNKIAISGYATKINTSSIKNSKQIPNATTFYLVFKNKQITEIKSVEMIRQTKNVLRARIVFCGSDGGQDLGVYGGSFSGTVNNKITLPGAKGQETSIEITKLDKETKKPLDKVGFIVELEGQGYVKDGTPATYVSKEKATVYKTGTNGKVTIKNLTKQGKYKIYEVINPHFGYEEVSQKNPKLLHTESNVQLGETKKVTINNKRMYINISGYVWEDKALEVGKETVRNALFDEGKETKMAGVKVTLRKGDGSIIAEQITKEEGYRFEKIKIDDLDNKSYIEFEYDGMKYASVPVKQELPDNGSKATDEVDREKLNEKYKTITGSTKVEENNPIKANTKDTKIGRFLGQNQYSLDEIKKDNTIEEITNINLGLREREQPDLAVVEDIDCAKISLNGYEHIYQYGDRYQKFEKETEKPDFNIEVSFGEKFGPKSYTRMLYESDVKYNSEQEKGKLEVYITYKVAIRNEASNIYTKANDIINYYDSKYESVEVGTEIEDDGRIKEDKKLEATNPESYNTKYNKITIHTNQEIEPQKHKDIYLCYKLSNDAINDLLNGETTLNSITEIASYSSYRDSAFKESYAGIDKDSTPENAIPDNKNTYEDDTDAAPALKLDLKEGRTIKGTVWEDSAEKDKLKAGERIGDGKYDAQNENVVEGVTVELIDKETKEVAKLYQKAQDQDVDARKTTGKDGIYEFSGVIPGKYLIRYTYGDKSIICDTTGKEQDGQIEIEDYKSTIYQGGSTKEPLKDYWYRNSTDRLSDAKDEIGIYEDGTKIENFVDERIKTKDINYGSVSKEQNKLKSIVANTAEFTMDMDYDVSGGNITKEDKNLIFVFENIDFGIIERPIQKVEVSKEVENVEVTLANGQTIIQGNPKNGWIKNLKSLDGQVFIEIDSELIQGATLKAKYKITIDSSKTEIDYADKNYYIYGIKNNANQSGKPEINIVYDYLSDGLVMDVDSEINKKYWTVKDIIDLKKNEDLSEGALNAIKEQNTKIYCANLENAKKDDGKIILEMEASKLLSNYAGKDDLDFDNGIEINQLKGNRKLKDSTPGNYVPGSSENNEPDNDNKIITIIPPTGEDYNYLPYLMVGISGLILLGVGVIGIKKKIMK